MFGADVRGGRGEVTASVNLMTFPQQDVVTHAFPIWPLMLLLAPIIGSFLGVLIRRLPGGRPVAFARSACESCGTVLTVRDLIPLVSYGLQRGRCRRCGAAISRFHPAIELAAIGVALWAMTVDDGDWLIADCALGWTLLALAVCDWRSYRLPDALTLPLILLGLAATWRLRPEELTAHALAAALAYTVFRALSWLYRRLRGREGLGKGDAKLLAAAGAWVGLVPLGDVVLAAAALGLLLAVILALRTGRPLSGQTVLPFGPCLACATWLVWLYIPA
jgi:leader peptidase (prepilin peptidase) / N-methyltransferase